MPTDDITGLLDSLTPEVYNALKTAVELGKWPNGVRLDKQQREWCLQAVIYYDFRHKTEQERIGQIQRDDHEHCGSHGDAEHDHSNNRWDETQLLVLQNLIDSSKNTHH